MRETLKEKIANAKDLLDVLLILKEKIMQDIHVSSLAYLNENIERFNGKYGIWRCKPFPLEEDQPEYNIQAYYFSEEGDKFVSGSMVLVVFTDQNFINNLKSAFSIPKPTTDLIRHSLKYGVIISLPGLGLTEVEKQEILDI